MLDKARRRILGSVDKPIEEGIRLGEHLWMPLHTEHISSGELDGFDDLIRGLCHRDETGPELRDGLMVVAIHKQFGTYNRFQRASDHHPDPVRTVRARIASIRVTFACVWR